MQNAIITLDNATIINENNVIFSSINFKVNAGEFIFLIGKTGAGKSSLLKVLYGDLTLESGKGSIVGFDLTELKDKEIPLLRRKIGVVFQDFKLLPDRTIFENLSFVLKATGWKEKSKIKVRVIEVLNLVNISPETQKYPFELSGGEQQRVAIARALLNEPELIIADEPTGNLDTKSSTAITDLLFSVNDLLQTTLVLVTHDLALAEKCSKVYELSEGRLL